MIFTILTFRALGRTHIASKPCVAIAMLCFDSTVGFPWSVPVLKQQLTAGAQRPFAREGAAWPAAIFVRPEQAPLPPRGGRGAPCQGPGPPGRSEGQAQAQPSTHRRKPKASGPRSPRLPFSHKKNPRLLPSALNPLWPHEEVGPVTGPSAAVLDPADPRRRLEPLRPHPSRDGLRGSPHRGSGAGPFLSRLVFRPWLGQPPALLSEPLLLPKLRS